MLSKNADSRKVTLITMIAEILKRSSGMGDLVQSVMTSTHAKPREVRLSLVVHQKLLHSLLKVEAALPVVMVEGLAAYLSLRSHR